MDVKPRWVSILGLLKTDCIFVVPKYQRDYRWGKDEIEDFCSDVEQAFQQRTSDAPVDHFFGGIVTVSKAIDGSETDETKVIDGQQRLTTITLLLTAIIRRYETLIIQAGEVDDEEEVMLYKDRLAKLRSDYLEVKVEKNRKMETRPKLVLSEADNDIFRDLVSDQLKLDDNARQSHLRLASAFDSIQSLVNEISAGDYQFASNSLKDLQDVLDNDLTLIDISTTTNKEAYKLFQVLNDRGVNLAEGDLLRATTLESLDIECAADISRKAANDWDEILGDDTNDIRDQLRWHFTALQGQPPMRAKLFDQFRDEIFSECGSKECLSENEAKSLGKKISELKESVYLIRKLSSSEWPYAKSQDVTAWDRSRLNMLVTELRHTVSMPLLLSASKNLTPKEFSELIQIIERFAFRYKNLAGAHISKAQNIYFKFAKEIGDGKDSNKSEFRKELNSLLDDKVDDELFASLLRSMKYQTEASNRLLKYFLIMLEDHWRWFMDGANGNPLVQDKSRILHMDDTTLEHVYPQNSAQEQVITELEPKIHELGNLTLLGPKDNNELSNNDFDEKRDQLTKTSISMNRWFENNELAAESIDARRDQMIELAVRIFRA